MGVGRMAAVVVVCLLVGGAAQAAQSTVGARVAKRLVGLSSMAHVTTQVPDDCSGVVRLPYLAQGVDLLEGMYPRDWNAVTIMYARARKLRALSRPTPSVRALRDVRTRGCAREAAAGSRGSAVAAPLLLMADGCPGSPRAEMNVRSSVPVDSFRDARTTAGALKGNVELSVKATLNP